jgi:hypothetical protein
MDKRGGDEKNVDKLQLLVEQHQTETEKSLNLQLNLL